MRKTSLNCVYELAQKDERVVFIGSDLGVDTLNDFKQNIPDRFFMEGIAEGNIIGIAAGMAFDGFIPYVNTIATFLTRRCYEQLVDDLCLHNLPVRLIGNGGGLVYAPLGPTHLATDDIAIMRVLPNMTVVAPCDADEMTRLIPQIHDLPGPAYIRLAKGGDPIISKNHIPCELGKGIIMREGPDVLLISSGVMTTQALLAADQLAKTGIEASVVHFHTIKPLDTDLLLRLCNQISPIVTIDEHSLTGGLGSAVLETLVDAGSSVPKTLRLGIPDCFPEHYGSQIDLLNTYGLTGEKISSRVFEFLQ